MRETGDHGPRHSRRAFTLLELLAALALSGVAIGGAWRLLQQMGDARDRVKSATIHIARTQNGERLLRSLVLGAHAGIDTAERFSGDSASARFHSWCSVPGGWQRGCRVELSVHAAGDSTEISARIDPGSTAASASALALVLLRRAGPPVVLRYIETTPDSMVWARTWQGSITTPAGIAVVDGRDTLVLPIGVAR